jgi:hypothetical protein
MGAPNTILFAALDKTGAEGVYYRRWWHCQITVVSILEMMLFKK